MYTEKKVEFYQDSVTLPVPMGRWKVSEPRPSQARVIINIRYRRKYMHSLCEIDLISLAKVNSSEHPWQTIDSQSVSQANVSRSNGLNRVGCIGTGKSFATTTYCMSMEKIKVIASAKSVSKENFGPQPQISWKSLRNLVRNSHYSFSEQPAKSTGFTVHWCLIQMVDPPPVLFSVRSRKSNF